jgi:hypothetical protein
MPETSSGHAATTFSAFESPQMEAEQRPVRLLEESHQHAPQSKLTGRIFDTSDASLGSPVSDRQQKKPLDKKSLDYIMKSGVAGGLAGCAVGAILYPNYTANILSRRRQWLVHWTE